MNREDGILFKDKILTKDQSVTTYSYEDLILLCGDIILKQEEENQELHMKIKDANIMIKNLKNNVSIPRKVYRKIKTIIKKSNGNSSAFHSLHS